MSRSHHQEEVDSYNMSQMNPKQRDLFNRIHQQTLSSKSGDHILGNNDPSICSSMLENRNEDKGDEPTISWYSSDEEQEIRNKMVRKLSIIFKNKSTGIFLNQ